MSLPQSAPRLRRQLLLLLLGASWLCLLSIGGLSGAWLYHVLLADAEPELDILAERTDAALQQLQGRQRDRVALLAARTDLRQTLQAVSVAISDEPARNQAKQRLGELLGDAIGTVPSFRHAIVFGADGQVLAGSDPNRLPNAGQQLASDIVGLRSDYLSSGQPSQISAFQHRIALIWEGKPLGSLLVEESAAELRALLMPSNLDPNSPASNRYQLRLWRHHDHGSEQLAGAPISDAVELRRLRPLTIPGWQLEVAVARATVLQPLYHWLGGLLLLAVLLTTLIVLIGGRAAERFSAPLALLARYVGEWRVGTPWLAQVPADSSAELQQLADGLTEMARRENAGQKALTEALLETQQVEEQFRRLFENSPVACLLADQEGRIQLINPACASLFGYRVEELRGESVERLMPVAARSSHHQRMQQFFSAPRERLLGVSNDLFGLRRDGVQLQIEIGVTPIRLGGEALALATINDLSTRKAYEQALLAMSRTDGLTGIPNRRHFDQVLADEWRRLKRSQQGAAVLMIDIDHFKLLNDRHGHLVGDETLRMVSKALKQQLHRPGDFLARFGGEEFVVLLPDTDRDGAQLLAEQMRQAVANLPAVNSSDGTFETSLSISVGVGACRNCNLQDAADLLAEADRLLYGAKRAGRNRVMA